MGFDLKLSGEIKKAFVFLFSFYGEIFNWLKMVKFDYGFFLTLLI